MAIFFDSHGHPWEQCSPDAEGAVAFGPTGSARPAPWHPSEMEIFSSGGTPDDQGWVWATRQGSLAISVRLAPGVVTTRCLGRRLYLSGEVAWRFWKAWYHSPCCGHETHFGLIGPGEGCEGIRRGFIRSAPRGEDWRRVFEDAAASAAFEEILREELASGAVP